MADRLDWVAKRKIVEQYMAEEGLDWTDDALHSVDLEYHNIDPEKASSTPSKRWARQNGFSTTSTSSPP